MKQLDYSLKTKVLKTHEFSDFKITLIWEFLASKFNVNEALKEMLKWGEIRIGGSPNGNYWEYSVTLDKYLTTHPFLRIWESNVNDDSIQVDYRFIEE